MKALFPGTFDPVTEGHVALVSRATCLFEHVIVGVAETARKTTWLSWQTRIALTQQAFAAMPGVEVCPLEGLSVYFALQKGANVLLRGVRNGTDFDYENTVGAVNRTLLPQMETLFLPAVGPYAAVSSTVVREVFAVGGDISSLVPACVQIYVKGLVDGA